MKRAIQGGESGAVSDMSIVDTFTKLIFGEDTAYSDQELLIIQALRSVDGNVALDSHREMGVYLRALGVREMISLVGQVQIQLASGSQTATPLASQPSAASGRSHPTA